MKVVLQAPNLKFTFLVEVFIILKQAFISEAKIGIFGNDKVV